MLPVASIRYAYVSILATHQCTVPLQFIPITWSTFNETNLHSVGSGDAQGQREGLLVAKVDDEHQLHSNYRRGTRWKQSVDHENIQWSRSGGVRLWQMPRFWRTAVLATLSFVPWPALRAV